MRTSRMTSIAQGVRNLFGRSRSADRTADQSADATEAAKASAILPDVPMPQAPTGQKSQPSYRTEATRSSDLLGKTNRVTANTDATSFRTGTEMSQVIRNFLESNPDMSATVSAYLRVGIPKGYRVTAHDMDGRLNIEGTKLAYELLTRISFLGDPTAGYNPTSDLQSMSESLGRELLLEGACSLELVVDDMGLPIYPQPVAVSTLFLKEDAKKGVYPVQVIGDKEIPLDIPTMFYISVDQDLLTPYAVAYLGVAIRAVLADEGFSNFLQRQLKRNIAPRMIAKVIEEKLKKSVDPRTLNDPNKFRDYMVDLIANLTSQLEDLEPDEALVSTDSIEYKLEAPGGSGTGVGNMLEAVHRILQDRVTASLKSLPAVLGRDTSSGSATTSTYLFMKSAEMLSNKLNTLYSRMLTVAARLQGVNCIVKFEYDDLDLRPKAEQEAYKQMRQSRILNLLSLGFYTDEQASIELIGQLPPEGMKPLSGTMFMSPNNKDIPNTTSQTALMNGQQG